jgi:hypothetical protein
MMIVTMMPMMDTRSGEGLFQSLGRKCLLRLFTLVRLLCFRSPDDEDDGDGKSKKDGDT